MVGEVSVWGMGGRWEVGVGLGGLGGVAGWVGAWVPVLLWGAEGGAAGVVRGGVAVWEELGRRGAVGLLVAWGAGLGGGGCAAMRVLPGGGPWMLGVVAGVGFAVARGLLLGG